jgi:hypothetical protein
MSILLLEPAFVYLVYGNIVSDPKAGLSVGEHTGQDMPAIVECATTASYRVPYIG